MILSNGITVDENELEWSAIRAQGSGGQNVNKVATAFHLRFDIRGSSLPEELKISLLKLGDRRITRDGILVIKAQRFRTQEKNRDDALQRLRALLEKASQTSKPRKPTRPTASARKKRTDTKTRRGQIKRLRGPVADH